MNPRLLSHDDTGGDGRLVVMLPGAGDVRSEYRFLARRLAAAGHRVVTADLAGHGDSPAAKAYTVSSTASDLIDLIEHLDGGPAVVVACSFAPAAVVWAAAERPDLINGLVALSPHFEADDTFKGRLLTAGTKVLMRGPWAAGTWAKLYAGWYKTNPPQDLPAEIEKLRAMMADPARRRAVRHTLTADRSGVAEKMAAVDVPTLTIFGSLDDHFVNPQAEAEAVLAKLGGSHLLVDGAGHYPHVEAADVVADAIQVFLKDSV
ncbi:MAG TPA: alpha/beta hydrolase [Acidimicrobiia bacterium]|nr:alpha/beta hydrolase [Acidimicrobiia bacterium]